MRISQPRTQAISGRLAICVFALAVAANAQPQDQQTQFPDGTGKDTFLRVCSSCHGAQMVLGRGNTKDGWTDIVVSMAQRGAQASDDEFEQIVDYLAQSFPPKTDAPKANAVTKINVNKATSDELKTGLDLSSKEADAIVAYRQQNGDFKSVEQLEKVPGVTASKIEAKKDQLTF